ncbi:hypothetical protein [Nannocystis pusilla]|uniref:hypothetical protein n=1 Tax=Nannocystis pusilla TaxID=889268 RepID=UPI003BEFCB18
MSDEARAQSLLRRWILPLALMSAPWAIYVAVLSQQEVDALAILPGRCRVSQESEVRIVAVVGLLALCE